MSGLTVNTKATYISILQLSVILAILLAFSLHEVAALEDGTEIKADDYWQVTSPGSTVAFDLRFKNPSAYYDDFFLYVENPPLPENWVASFYFDGKKVKGIGVEANQTVNVALLVKVPEDAVPGDYRFRVQFAGRYANATRALTVTVESVLRGISVASPIQSQSILTGRSSSFPILVTNNGLQNETILLMLNRTSELMPWDISFSENELTLAPREDRLIMLSIKPPTIVREDYYPINIMASTRDGKVKATTEVTVRILGSYLLEIVGIQPINPQVNSGEKIDVIVTVRNMGESPLTRVRLKVTSGGISNILITPLDVLVLEPFADVSFYVRLSPNSGLTPGDYVIDVQAESSEVEGGVRAFVVSVTSPVPWFWISIGVTVVATGIAVIVIERLISRFGIALKIRR